MLIKPTDLIKILSDLHSLMSVCLSVFSSVKLYHVCDLDGHHLSKMQDSSQPEAPWCCPFIATAPPSLLPSS